MPPRVLREQEVIMDDDISVATLFLPMPITQKDINRITDVLYALLPLPTDPKEPAP